MRSIPQVSHIRAGRQRAAGRAGRQRAGQAAGRAAGSGQDVGPGRQAAGIKKPRGVNPGAWCAALGRFSCACIRRARSQATCRTKAP